MACRVKTAALNRLTALNGFTLAGKGRQCGRLDATRTLVLMHVLAAALGARPGKEAGSAQQWARELLAAAAHDLVRSSVRARVSHPNRLTPAELGQRGFRVWWRMETPYCPFE